MSHSTYSSKMKYFGSLCIFLILVHFSTQTPKFENCPEDMKSSPNICESLTNTPCCKVTCSLDGTDANVAVCPVSQCLPGRKIGYHDGDSTKEYPGCCGHPICKD